MISELKTAIRSLSDKELKEQFEMANSRKLDDLAITLMLGIKEELEFRGYEMTFERTTK